MNGATKPILRWNYSIKNRLNLLSDISGSQPRNLIIKIIFRLNNYLILNLFFTYNDCHVQLRSKKAGGFVKSLVLLGVIPLWHVATWVSFAPPHHTLPAFLNLSGRKVLLTLIFRTIAPQIFVLKIYPVL